ncbi:MAG TPA: asparagine synthase-related protein [Gaiellaceae bacterium]|nr:asparagine synthase-related protein [Gaiellaceae bacterium]
MSVDPASRADPLRGGRVQIGGVVGAGLDAVTLARFSRALGPQRQVLDPSRRTFVADWDACRLAGSAIGAAELEAATRQGRLGDLDGAFALAWLDVDGLHLVRDPVGERGAYYAHVSGGIAFASTLRPLLDGGLVRRVLNAGALPAYLSYGYVPGRETLVEGIFELLPGQHLVFRGGRVRDDRIWSLPAEDVETEDEEVYRLRLRARLEAAVRGRLPVSGPVAATLSGGIDSSVVAALASRLQDGLVSTFSLSFGRGIPNELEYASAVAAHCGTEHHVVELLPRAVMERFDETIGALSTPIGEPLTVANSVLFEAASEQAAVVLNGEGGDPCFGGPKNVPMVLSALYGANLERSYLLAHRKCFAELDRMLVPGLLEAAGLEAMLSPHLYDPRWSTLVNRLMALNVTSKGGHHILPKVAQLSRPHGVLPRSPLFDRGVVDVALRMPAELKLRGTVEKYIFKRAVEDLLPAEIVMRRKSGMRVPVEAWLQGKFDRFARERLLDGLAPYGIIQRPYLEDLARPDRKLPPARRGAKIWLLLSLEAWLRTVLAPTGADKARQ